MTFQENPEFDPKEVLSNLMSKGAGAFPVSPDGLRVTHISLYCYLSFPVRSFHALCQKAGVDSQAIFFKNSRANIHRPVTDKELGYILGLIKDHDPQVILMSVLAPYIQVTKDLIKAIRIVSQAPIVMGGKYSTIEPDKALAFVDYACKGEGEYPIIDILNRLAQGKTDFSGLTGLWHKDSDGAVVDLGQHRLIDELDELPDPAVGVPKMYFIEGSAMRDDDPELNNDIISVMAGRGCVYQCTYCVNALLIPMNRKNGKLLRLRSPERVIAEIQSLMAKQKHAAHVLFHDEVLGMYHEWVEVFAALYKKEIGLPFEIELIPKLIKEENVKVLADAGMVEMGFGIQSGSQEIRNKILRRPGSNDEIVEKAELLRREGVKGRYDIILDNPFETVESLEEGLALLMRMPEPIRIFPFKMQYFRKYPFSEAALSAGHITEADVSDESISQSTMFNWTYIPRLFNLGRHNYLQSCIYLYSSAMETETKKKITSKLLDGHKPLYGSFVNMLAWCYYQYGHKQNPIFVWGRRVLVAFKMIGRGDFGQLSASAKTVVRRLVHSSQK